MGRVGHGVWKDIQEPNPPWAEREPGATRATFAKLMSMALIVTVTRGKGKPEAVRAYDARAKRALSSNPVNASVAIGTVPR